MIREQAISILVKVQVQRGYANLLLDDVIKKNNYSENDNALLTKLVYGTIQHQIYLDYQLSFLLKQKKAKPFEKQLLLISLYQFIYLTKIPNYAIINEAVEIAKRKRGIPTSKFINAVLRSFIKVGPQEIIASSKEQYLSIKSSHPLWLIKLLFKQYGEEETKKITEANLQVPNLTARVNTLVCSREAFLENYPNFKAGNISKDALIYQKGGNLATLEVYKEGKITIQDESSQLVAHLLHPTEHSYVLDMCSAPGNKTTHLSQIMQNTGRIDAYDIHKSKIATIEQNAKRLHITNIHAFAFDSTKLISNYDLETFDYILLDAPCSGLGVIARKPEIKYHDSAMMDSLIPLQKELLEVAYQLLKKGGQLVYSTCTINKKENENQITNFLKNHQDMRKEFEQTILPYMYQSDGFYMCKLVK